jgi:hypothetical protein
MRVRADAKALGEKYAIVDTPSWSPECRYWNNESKTWDTLDNATLYDTYPNALQYIAVEEQTAMHAYGAKIWTDAHPEIDFEVI